MRQLVEATTPPDKYSTPQVLEPALPPASTMQLVLVQEFCPLTRSFPDPPLLPWAPSFPPAPGAPVPPRPARMVLSRMTRPWLELMTQMPMELDRKSVV